MIALMFLAAIAVWLVVVIFLCKWIPRWLGILRLTKAAQFILFSIFLVLPFSDELIGRWQFKELCERESVVYLSDDWQKVKWVKNISPAYSKDLNGYLVRIKEREFKYQNIETGKILFQYSVFYNYGGFLMDRMGLRLSGAPPDCWPKDEQQIRKKINLQQLLDQGKNK